MIVILMVSACITDTVGRAGSVILMNQDSIGTIPTFTFVIDCSVIFSLMLFEQTSGRDL